jgi:predicted RNase H-like HicB family nuclease
MVQASFTAIIEPDEGGYHAYIPALPGCHTWGQTIDEARANLLEAASLHIEAMREQGEEIPDEPEPVIITRVTVPLAS